MTSFAENEIIYEDGQPNVVEPPETLMANGWIPKRKGANGQPIVANWLNWIFREIFRKLNMSALYDGAGVNTIKSNDCFIVLYAMNKTDPSMFLHAIGYKTGSGTPVFRVLNSGGLTLGNVTPTDTPINGGPASSIILKAIITENT